MCNEDGYFPYGIDETTEIVHCSNNKNIETLPELPSSVRELKVSNTNITTLPELPPNLELLDISETHITSLPKLPDGLVTIRMVDVPLESIPIIPESVTTIRISLLPNKKRNPSFDAIVETYNKTKDVEAFKRAVKEVRQRLPDVLSLAYGSRGLPSDSVTAIASMLGSNSRELESMRTKLAKTSTGGKKTRRRNMRKKRTMKRKARRT